MGEILKYIYPVRKPQGPEGKVRCTVHLLEGYNDRSLSAYMQMATRLRETFPGLRDQDIICGEVRESPYCKGFSLVHARVLVDEKALPDGRQEYHGFTVLNGNPDYRW